MINKIVVLTGIFPPEIGGPATFAATFPNWLEENHFIKSEVITLIADIPDIESSKSKGIYCISKKQNIIFRILKTILQIIRRNSKGTIFIANGLFLEILIARIFSKIKFVAKIPGDIVWERSRNLGRTKANFAEFQNVNLKARDRLNRFIFTSCLRKAEKIIAPTQQLANIINNWGIPENKILVIPNGVDSSVYKPSKIEKKIDVICVSRLVPWKHIDEIIKATAALKLKLVIVGNGPEIGNLTSLANNLNADVEFIGIVRREELIKLYQQSRLYILNSSFELTSYSLIEAQLCGIFSISNTDTGSADVIVDGKTGILINGTNCETLQAAITDYFRLFEKNVSAQVISAYTKNRFDLGKTYESIYKSAVFEK